MGSLGFLLAGGDGQKEYYAYKGNDTVIHRASKPKMRQFNLFGNNIPY